MSTFVSTLLRPALVLLGLATALFGLVYPFAITAAAQLVVPRQASGSLLVRDGVVVGSALVGQRFAADRYFHGRPSAAGEGYDGAASSGSNRGPTSRQLLGRVAADVARLGGSPARPLPADAVTTSGSGLDPHVSPANALAQVPRVARARGLAEADVQALVASSVEMPWLGFLGQPRVNVLVLNLALDDAGG